MEMSKRVYICVTIFFSCVIFNNKKNTHTFIKKHRIIIDIIIYIYIL